MINTKHKTQNTTYSDLLLYSAHWAMQPTYTDMLLHRDHTIFMDNIYGTLHTLTTHYIQGHVTEHYIHDILLHNWAVHTKCSDGSIRTTHCTLHYIALTLARQQPGIHTMSSVSSFCTSRQKEKIGERTKIFVTCYECILLLITEIVCRQTQPAAAQAMLYLYVNLKCCVFV